MLPRSAALSSAVNRLGRMAGAIGQMLAVAEADVRKLRHDPLELFTRMVQPALWLLIFGQVLARTRAMPTGPVGYVAFVAPGILAQSVLFVAIFYGVSLIWERDLGILHKYLVSPAPRYALVLGRALSSGVRGVSQALVVYALAAALGVPLRTTPWDAAGVLSMVMLGSAVFSTFSLLVACLVKTRERFMGIGQVLTMPLFFASNAIYPLSLMPDWLHAFAIVNPLTYQVDALRRLMIEQVPSTFGLATDFAVQIVALLLLTLLATRLYPRIING
ncbi:ABC transporter permease [Janthinobacterium sp.]|uniref:ABC transporter permease n=1 Tax=Janthinobacterium sp. TaxID=1871054 RepID=UPI002DBEDB47|nr:ABC transporter permease [Janthinobacterium sp.]HEU4818453.1 ABC transporter permease [Janthinobacterium sp.]